MNKFVTELSNEIEFLIPVSKVSEPALEARLDSYDLTAKLTAKPVDVNV